MGTTPNKAIPYAEPTDLLRDAATAQRLGAERVDALLTALDPLAFHASAATGALTNNTWTDLVLTPLEETGEALNASGASITYTGPARLFMVSFGANLAVSGSQPTGYMRLVFGETAASELIHSDNYQHLGGAIPMLLGTGAAHTAVRLQVKANDGSGAAGGAVDNGWLRVASL